MPSALRPRAPSRFFPAASSPLGMLLALLATSGCLSQALAQQSQVDQLVGHTAGINSAIYAPDGSLVATAASDQLIKLWNPTTGKEVRTLQGHTGQVLSLAISPDNRTLISGAADNSLRQWDLPRSDPLHVFEGHAARVNQVVLDPRGRLAVTGGVDKSLRLWDLEEQKITAIWQGHTAAVSRLAYRADGNEIASADSDGAILLWNILTGKPLAEVGAHQGEVTGLAYHPNNQQLISSGADGLLQVWQLPIMPARSLGEFAAPVSAVALTSDSQTGVIAAGGVLQVVSLSSGAELRLLEGQRGVTTSASISPNNTLVAAANDQGSVQLWNLADGASRGSLAGHGEAINDIAFGADNQRLATAGADGTVRLWRMPVPALPLAGHTADCLATAADPQGKFVATASADNTIRLFDPTTGQALRQIAGHAAAVGVLAVAADGSQLVSGDALGEVRLSNPADASLLSRLGAHAGEVTAAAYHPIEPMFVTAGNDGTLKSWRLPLPPAQSLPGHAEAVTAVAMAEDASLMVTGGADKIVRIYQGDSGELLRSLEPTAAAVTSLALPREASVVAAGTADGTVRFWNAADGTPWQGERIEPAAAEAVKPAVNLTPHSLFGHVGAIRQIDYHAPSGRIATAGADGTVRVWRLPTGPATLVEAAAPASQFVVSPDGSQAALATTLAERPAVMLYDLSSGKLLQTLLGQAAAIGLLAFNPEGNLLASAAENTVAVWDLADAKYPQQHKLVQAAAVTAVAFSADSAQLLVATEGNAIHRWSLAEEEEVGSLTGHSGVVGQLVVRGTTLYSAGADSAVRSWNLQTGAAMASLNHGAAVQSLAVAADGSIIASGGADNTIKLWNAADGSPRSTLNGHAGPVGSLAFSGDGTLLVSGSAESHRLWDVASGRPLQTFPSPEWPLLGAAFANSPDATIDSTGLSSHRLAVAGADGAVRIYQSDLLQWLPAHPGEVTGVRFLPGGERLLTSSQDNAVVEWDLTTGKQTRTFAGPTAGVTSLALTTDGSLLAAGSTDQHVYIWDMSAASATGASLPAAQTLSFAAPVHAVAFSVQGPQLACGLADNRVHVWDIAAQRELQRFQGHTEAVTSVAISADGRALLSGSSDKTALKWTVSAELLPSEGLTRINDLAFTPDGAKLIAASDLSDLTVWPLDAAAQFAESASLPSAGAKSEYWPEAAKQRLAINSAGTQLAVLDSLGQVARWDLASGALLDLIAPLPAPIESPPAAVAPETAASPVAIGDIGFNPEGTLLAIGTGHQVRIHDVASARQLEIVTTTHPTAALAFTAENRLSLVGPGMAENAALHNRALERWWLAHEGPATALAFAPDGNSLVSGGTDARLVKWNLADGALLQNYAGATLGITDLAITADGTRLVAAAEDRMVRVWPFATEAPVENSPGGMEPSLELAQSAIVRRLGLSADNQQLVTVGDEPMVRLWDLTLGRQVQRWPAHRERVTAVAFAADNKTIVTGGLDQTAQLLRVNRLRTIAAHQGPISALALYNNGNQVATAGTEAIRFWNLADGNQIREIASPTPFTALAMRGDNAQLVAADADHKLHFYNPNDGTETTQFQLSAGVEALAYSADNQKLAAAMQDGGLRFYAPADGSLLYELASPEPLTSVAFTPDSRRVVTTGAEGAVALWSYAAPDAIRTLTGHGGNVYATAFSPDGTLIASASADQSIRLWDAATGSQRSQLTGHVGPVFSVAFSPNGALLVSCGADKSIRLWDVLGGRQLKQLPVGDSTLYSVAFHPGGKLVAAAGMDKKIYVHDILAGTLQTTLTGHDDYIYRVAYNQNGNRLLSCGYGGNVIVWNAGNGQKLFEKALGEVSSYADYAPENDRILVAGGDGRARFIQLPATVQ